MQTAAIASTPQALLPALADALRAALLALPPNARTPVLHAAAAAAAASAPDNAGGTFGLFVTPVRHTSLK